MPKFMERVGELVETVPVKSWQAYLRWNLINNMAPHLSNELVMQDFHFFKQVMAGAEEIDPVVWYNIHPLFHSVPLVELMNAVLISHRRTTSAATWSNQGK